MLNKVEVYYFSPTGGTKKVASEFAQALCGNVVYKDLGKDIAFVVESDSDLLIIAMPVFSGRIPALMADKIKSLNMQGKRVVTMVVYGNRAYEDALLELNDVVLSKDAVIVASAALIAKHSIVTEVAAKRPDEQDIAEIKAFAEEVKLFIKKNVSDEISVKVPGAFPYREVNPSTATPICKQECTLCGSCKNVCPAKAIEISSGKLETAGEKCILCMACVSVCPSKQRMLPEAMQAGLNQKLSGLINVRNKNEFFMPAEWRLAYEESN